MRYEHRKTMTAFHLFIYTRALSTSRSLTDNISQLLYFRNLFYSTELTKMQCNIHTFSYTCLPACLLLLLLLSLQIYIWNIFFCIHSGEFQWRINQKSTGKKGNEQAKYEHEFSFWHFNAFELSSSPVVYGMYGGRG